MPDEMNDPEYCLKKVAEYRAKAQAAADRLLKSTFEAAAREYEHRATELKAGRTP
jgi:hypothetical protein